jgi:hypothetical protein
MSAFTDFLEQNLRDHFRRDTQLSLEDTYVALLTSDPGETGSTASELTTGWYSRQQVHQTTTQTPYWTSATGGTGIENNSAVTFGTATGTVTGVSHVGLIDQSTTGGGNMLLKTALNTAKTPQNNDPVEFSAGNLSFTFD